MTASCKPGAMLIVRRERCQNKMRRIDLSENCANIGDFSLAAVAGWNIRRRENEKNTAEILGGDFARSGGRGAGRRQGRGRSTAEARRAARGNPAGVWHRSGCWSGSLDGYFRRSRESSASGVDAGRSRNGGIEL